MLAKLIRTMLTWRSLQAPPLWVLLLSAAILGGTPLLSVAQGGSISGQVVQPAPPVGTGGPAANPLIYVCPSTSSGNPCPATVLLYSAPQLGACSPSCAVSNPYTGDAFGNYSVWAAPGPYLVQVVPVVGTTYQYLVMAVGGTVTSITIVPSSLLFTSNGCGPITTTGVCTFNLASQAANQVFASPNGGAGTPFFRNIVGPDFGSLIIPTWVLANCTGATTSPSFCAITAAMIPATLNGETFNGNVQVNGTFGATGAATLGSTLNLTGAATFNSTLLVNGTIAGNANLAANVGFFSSLSVNTLVSSPIYNVTNVVTGGYEIGGTFGNVGQALASTGTATIFSNFPGQAALVMTAGTGAGTSPSFTCTGCQDSGGYIFLTTGSSTPSSGTVLTGTFGVVHTNGWCTVSAENAAAATAIANGLVMSPNGGSGTAFVLFNSGSAVTSGNTYELIYTCTFHN